MTKQLPHADVIKHMAEHGFDSVECRMRNDDTEVFTASGGLNPVSNPHWQWRIKPNTITVEIPRPKVWGLDAFHDGAIQLIFDSLEDRDTARGNIKKAMGL